MMDRHLIVGAVGGMLLSATVAARPPGTARAPEAPARLWASTCGYCHGGPMKAPELRGLSLPEDAVIDTVRRGAAGMPPFHQTSIGDAELRALARWIARQPAPTP